MATLAVSFASGPNPRVAVVFQDGPQVQVIWSDTGWIVAMVQDPCPGRDLAVMKHPTHPVRTKMPVVHLDLPVPLVGAPPPNPTALLGRGNTMPELLGQGFHGYKLPCLPSPKTSPFPVEPFGVGRGLDLAVANGVPVSELVVGAEPSDHGHAPG
jgi:hypothetical protein